MRIPLSWLTQLVPAVSGATTADIAARLTRAGFEVEGIEVIGADVRGVVVGQVLEFEAEPQKNGKTIRWCQVDVGEETPRGIVCGAGNFAVGDKVAAALPGAVLPGPFPIAARKTYGHVSDGMLCSGLELGIGDDHDGILILPADAPLGADVTVVLGVEAETILDLAITPDRGYALSLRGIAREVATAWDAPFDDPANFEVPALTAGHPVRIEDPTACDRYVARIVTGLDAAAPTPERMAELVGLTGMRSISLAVDVTNYVMMLLGQPLHAFDAAKLRGEIVIRRAVAGERLTTLDGVTRSLDPEDIVIADDSGPIALGGVMGGASTEVSAATTSVLIEAAHFDAIAVTRSARRHNLASEASRRFERGVDPALPPFAAQLAVSLLVADGGASTQNAGTDVGLGGPRQVITFPWEAAARKAGRGYERDTVVSRLRDVGCTVADDGGAVLEVAPPSWRPDLTGEAELTEEIIRLEGYETLPSLLPRAVPGRGLTAAQRARRSVGRALAAAGLVEVTILPFVGAPALRSLGMDADDERLLSTRVANPLAEDNALLRTTLLPGLLEAGLRNVGRGNRDIALYEMGHVFRPGAASLPAAPALGTSPAPSEADIAALDAALPNQPLTVGVLITGNRTLTAWNAAGRPAQWSDSVAAAQTVAHALGIVFSVEAAARAPWHPGRCAALSHAGRLIGHAGELHPRVAKLHGFADRTVIAELDLTLLLTLLAPDPVAAPTVSAFPPVARDIALVISGTTPAAEVSAALIAGAGELLESLRLFDDYAGAQLGDGVRSLAYRLVFRAAGRTLTDEDANAARDAAIAAAGVLGATLRT